MDRSIVPLGCVGVLTWSLLLMAHILNTPVTPMANNTLRSEQPRENFNGYIDIDTERHRGARRPTNASDKHFGGCGRRVAERSRTLTGINPSALVSAQKKKNDTILHQRSAQSQIFFLPERASS